MTLRILVVCEGNVCRSPVAERLLAQRLEDAGVHDVSVTSAGTIGVVGSAMHPLAAAELTHLGGSPDGFVARRLTFEHVEQADLVLTATREVRAAVLEECPRAMRRTFTLLEYAALSAGAPAEATTDLTGWAAAHRALASGEPLDVPDPIGGSADLHRRVAASLDVATRAIATALAGAPRQAG